MMASIKGERICMVEVVGAGRGGRGGMHIQKVKTTSTVAKVKITDHSLKLSIR